VDLPEPFRWEDDQIVADLPHARAVFSTARGGVSSGPYDSLNLGMLTDDTRENVDENRRRLGETVGHPWPRFCYGRQVHGVRVRRATEPPNADRPYTEEDGQATALEDAAAIVFVADCLPVLLAAEGAVAALHGGWKPLAAGIVAEGVTALKEVGGTGPVTAALGPSARGCCYEVGEEVHAHFAAYDARRGERNLDLAAVATAQLNTAGIENVLDTGLCTMCAPPGLLFSHRRDKGVTGRQAGVICRV
jgi:YfiH family protein